MRTKWNLLRFLSGPLLSLLLGLSFLTSCSSLTPLDFLGKGVNTAANVQAGATNSQTLGTTQVVDQTVRRADNSTITQTRDENKVKSDSVQTVVVNEVSPLIVAIVVAGVLIAFWFLYKLPSPDQIWRKQE